MSIARTTRASKRGLPPGSPVYTGSRKKDSVAIDVISYDADTFTRTSAGASDCAALAAAHPGVTWIDVDSVHDVTVLEQLGKDYSLHPLTVEDIASTDQRPKIEDYGTYLYVVIRMLQFDEAASEIRSEQVSMILADRVLLTFQDGIQGDAFETVRERLRLAKGRVRTLGADYLCYCLIDAVVDGYFGILEAVGERIEDLEDALITAPTPATLQAIHGLKRELISLRKSIWPLREVIGWMQRDDSALLAAGTGVFFRDVYDHTIQIIDTVETYRDMLSGMLDMYMSSMSNKMNEIMKVLTIMSTLFIPLTFLVGVYGMNFEHMPELKMPWAYGALWAVMITVALAMLAFFRRRKWL